MGALVAVPFGDALAECIRNIPPGNVASCGVIARTLGDVRAARAVAEWLHEHPELDPLHAVVRADGRPVLGPVPAPRRGPSRASGTREAATFVEELRGPAILAELRAEQVRLSAQVRERDDPTDVRTLGGVDVAYVGHRAFAAAVVLDAEDLRVRETAVRVLDAGFPYIPSYLAFREFPAVREALSGLSRLPDLLFVDGHGRLHPAAFGFACFAGVSLDLPTIGIAKHPLAGRPSPRTNSDAIPIELEGSVRGYAWRPPAAARAFYVSVGHRITLGTALAWARRATRDRYPEPLRIADRLSKEAKATHPAEKN